MPRASNKVVELTIPILQNMELAACKTAEAVAEVMEFGEDKSAEVAMALIEACLNSFEHSRSKDKKVYITFLLEDGMLKIILRDRGRGFDPANIEEPRIEDKLKPGVSKRGWGLKLIEGMMDSVTIQSGPQGTTITMTKRK